MLTSNIFLTGATGFLGGELIKKLLSANPQSEFWLLIRHSRRQKAADRLEQILLNTAEKNGLSIDTFRNQIHLVVGDLTEHRFGLSDTTFQDLATKINQIYHCAASIHLIGDLEPIRKINYFGTQQVLELANIAFKRGHFQRLNYLSTAYIAGKRFGVIYENELVHQKGFCNNYERAKYETEQMVEAAKKELPITIFRPSIIVGNSKTGKTTSFNVIYEPIRLTYLGKLKKLPGTKQSILDVVPVDYVCDAIIALSSMAENTIGKTFHLSVGENLGEPAHKIVSGCYGYIKELTNRFDIDWDEPIPKFIHPLVLMTVGKMMIPLTKGKRKRLFEKIVTYSNYGYYYKTFNTKKTNELLRPLGIIPPRFNDYMDVICNYAIQTDFGKKNECVTK